MAYPLVSPEQPTPEDRNWLAKYIAVQRVSDVNVISMLKNAADDAQALVILKYNDDEKISARVAKYQATLLRREIAGVLADMYKGMQSVIFAGQQEAAVAAVEAELKHDADVLKILWPNTKRRKQFEDSFKEAARRNIRSAINRQLNPQYPLSQRVYKSGRLASCVLDRKINSAIARGSSAKDLAKLVKSDIAYGTPGGVSYAALRLARTEINNAFHAQAIQDAQDLPWVDEMEWHLSKVHEPQGCVCETYALERYFPVTGVPAKPHPQCMCYVTPKRSSYNDIALQLKSGQLDAYFESKYGMPAS